MATSYCSENVANLVQAKGLLALDFLSGGSDICIPVLASALQLASTKWVIYNVRNELSTEDVKICYEY